MSDPTPPQDPRPPAPGEPSRPTASDARPGRDPRLEIPDVLREPVNHPSLRPRESTFPAVAAVGEIGKALAIGLDFFFVGAAGAVLGWLIDRWLGTDPFGLLIGLAVGFLGGTFRLVHRLGREDAKQRPPRPPAPRR